MTERFFERPILNSPYDWGENAKGRADTMRVNWSRT
jgi:hypothetical protein